VHWLSNLCTVCQICVAYIYQKKLFIFLAQKSRESMLVKSTPTVYEIRFSISYFTRKKTKTNPCRKVCKIYYFFSDYNNEHYFKSLHPLYTYQRYNSYPRVNFINVLRARVSYESLFKAKT